MKDLYVNICVEGLLYMKRKNDLRKHVPPTHDNFDGVDRTQFKETQARTKGMIEKPVKSITMARFRIAAAAAFINILEHIHQSCKAPASSCVFFDSSLCSLQRPLPVLWFKQ